MPLIDLGILITSRGAQALVTCATVILLAKLISGAYNMITDPICRYTSGHWYARVAVFAIALSLIAIIIGIFLIIIS